MDLFVQQGYFCTRKYLQSYIGSRQDSAVKDLAGECRKANRQYKDYISLGQPLPYGPIYKTAYQCVYPPARQPRAAIETATVLCHSAPALLTCEGSLVARREGGLAPRDRGLVPRDGGLAPRDGGLVPRDGGLVPRDCGLVARDGRPTASSQRPPIINGRLQDQTQ